MKRFVLTASSNTGIGLWTTICVAFSSIFGCVSKNYKKKQDKVLDNANEELMESLSELGEDYVLSDYRVTWSGGLRVTVSAVAEKNGSRDYVKEAPSEAPASSNEQLVEILRKELNNLFHDVPINVIVSNLKKYQNKELNDIASNLETLDSKTVQINYLKEAINSIK